MILCAGAGYPDHGAASGCSAVGRAAVIGAAGRSARGRTRRRAAAGNAAGLRLAGAGVSAAGDLLRGRGRRGRSGRRRRCGSRRGRRSGLRRRRRRGFGLGAHNGRGALRGLLGVVPGAAYGADDEQHDYEPEPPFLIKFLFLFFFIPTSPLSAILPPDFQLSTPEAESIERGVSACYDGVRNAKKCLRRSAHVQF